MSEPRLYKEAKFAILESGSRPVSSYTVKLQRRPSEPLIIKAATHPDTVYDRRGNPLPNSGEVYSRTVVVPLGSSDVTH